MELPAPATRPAAPHPATPLAAAYGALFLIVGMQAAYLPVWLAARGMSPFEIGALLSLPMLVRIATTPFITLVADRRNAHRHLLITLAIGVLAAALALTAASGFIAILILMVLFATFWTAMMPLLETLTMRGVRAGQYQYGPVRLWGSLTFIVASITGGWALEQYGASSVMVLISASAACLVAAALILPKHTTAGRKDEPALASQPSWGDIFSLLKRPEFLCLLVASGAAQATHGIFYAFGTIHWRAIGISETNIGLLWAVGVAAEIVLFALSGRVIARVGAANLIVIGSAAAVLRWTLTAWDPGFASLFAIQILHGLTFGAVHLGAVHMISMLVSPERAATAQGLYATFAAGVFMALVLAASGPLYRAYAGGAYLAMAALAVFAFILALLLKRLTASP